MDLTTIKRRLESGEIRTTLEFQRDMQLMFINAMMYNDRQHAVYKIAMDMYDDVMKAIEVSDWCGALTSVCSAQFNRHLLYSITPFYDKRRLC